MTHDSGHLVIGILLFAVAIAMLAATVSWFYVIGGAIMRLIAKPAAGSQALAASRPAIVAAGRLRGLLVLENESGSSHLADNAQTASASPASPAAKRCIR